MQFREGFYIARMSNSMPSGLDYGLSRRTLLRGYSEICCLTMSTIDGLAAKCFSGRYWPKHVLNGRASTRMLLAAVSVSGVLSGASYDRAMLLVYPHWVHLIDDMMEKKTTTITTTTVTLTLNSSALFLLKSVNHFVTTTHRHAC